MEIAVRRLEARDAGRLVRCFERCYGHSYPNEVVYDEARLAELVASGKLRSVVAVAGDGKIVGHTGLKVASDVARVVEAGHTVVDPASRGRGVLAQLSAGLVALCRDEGFAGFVHYPTTAHEIIQRTSVRFGVETGLMLAYVPGETDYVGIEMTGSGTRIAATIVYQPVASLSVRDVALPDRYAEPLRVLYGQIGAERRPGAIRAPRGPSSIETRHEARRGLLRVFVERVGDDLVERLAALPAETLTAPVTHVDLPLEDPGSDSAVEVLAGRGFLYCGLLPEFAAGDVLRLQRIAGQPSAVYSPQLSNDGARAVLARIERDRRGAA